MGNIKCIELTKDNYKKYLDQVENLEQMVSDRMIQEGRIGQFFTTGREGIEEYILSENNTVIVAIDDEGKIESASYITQGQAPFTYNDITKYFKYGDEYRKYVVNSYSSELEYKKDLLKIYEIKLKAYEYAKNQVLKKCPKYNDNIMEFLQDELDEKENGFHEKSKLREELNMYMSEYIENLSKKDESIGELYDKFYWICAEDISQEFKKEVNLKTDIMHEYEALINSQKALVNNSKSKEYSEILQKGPLKILEKPKFKANKYYNANTKNAVEIDTYITNPNSRQGGLARIIVYEGLKKHIEKNFQNENNDEIYLCSTLHRDNISSKYVSEFFGLKDSLYVQRRNGRNREVHICRIARDEYKQYLYDIEDKLITLYGYNPENKKVPDSKMLDIIKEQLEYEEEQVQNLKVRSTRSYRGSFNGLTRKIKKIQELKEKARQIRGRMEKKVKSMMMDR